jgi:5-formyltetrahydrofolate cyclo-ligase
MLKQRKSMTAEAVDAKSDAIFMKIKELGMGFFMDPVFIYLSFNNEPDTYRIIAYFLENGVTVSVPVIVSKDMIKAVVIDSTDDLAVNRFGIYEPKQGREIDSENLGCIFVPGLAFGKDLGRIGFGRGYYDNYLRDTQAKKIGLAYDFQILPVIPSEANDVKMDMIITDTGIIR